MIAARPLARYSAVEGALASGFATAELHYEPGHDAVRVAAEAACNTLACCCMAEAPVTHEPVLALSLIGLARRYAGYKQVRQLPNAVVSTPPRKL